MNTSVQWRTGSLKVILCILIPIVCGYLFFEYSNFDFYSNNTQNSKYEISKFTASISATILGFLLTAIAVLTALMDKILIDNMRKTGHYPKFLRLAFLTSASFLVVTILCTLVLMFSRYDYIDHVFSFMVGFLTLSILMLIRTGYSFFKIIYNV